MYVGRGGSLVGLTPFVPRVVVSTVTGQNRIGQNGTDKMVRTKWHRQNGSNCYSFQFNLIEVLFSKGPSIYDVHTEKGGQAEVDACGRGEGVQTHVDFHTEN